jgi:hypothetical protein
MEMHHTTPFNFEAASFSLRCSYDLYQDACHVFMLPQAEACDYSLRLQPATTVRDYSLRLLGSYGKTSCIAWDAVPYAPTVTMITQQCNACGRKL